MTMMTMTITQFPDVGLCEGCPLAYTEKSPPWKNILGKHIEENILGKICWEKYIGKNIFGKNILGAAYTEISLPWEKSNKYIGSHGIYWLGAAYTKYTGSNK